MLEQSIRLVCVPVDLATFGQMDPVEQAALLLVDVDVGQTGASFEYVAVDAVDATGYGYVGQIRATDESLVANYADAVGKTDILEGPAPLERIFAQDLKLLGKSDPLQFSAIVERAKTQCFKTVRQVHVL